MDPFHAELACIVFRVLSDELVLLPCRIDEERRKELLSKMAPASALIVRDFLLPLVAARPVGAFAFVREERGCHFVCSQLILATWRSFFSSFPPFFRAKLPAVVNAALDALLSYVEWVPPAVLFAPPVSICVRRGHGGHWTLEVKGEVGSGEGSEEWQSKQRRSCVRSGPLEHLIISDLPFSPAPRRGACSHRTTRIPGHS